MQQTIYTPHATEPEKLAQVIADMQRLGTPTIRVVDCGDCYVALEGTHRLHAASALSLSPDLTVLEQDDLVEADSLDWQDLAAGQSYTAGELAGEILDSPNRQPLSLDI